MRLVGLELLPGVPDGGVLVRRVLQLDDPQGQAVHEQDDVGAVRVLVLGDGELVDREPVVGRGPVEVDDLRLRPADGSLGRAVLDLDAPHQHAVEGAVASREGRALGAGELAEGALEGVGGEVRVQRGEGVAQAMVQHNLPEVVALRRGTLGADVGPVGGLPAAVAEPVEGGLLGDGLGDAGHPFFPTPSTSALAESQMLTSSTAILTGTVARIGSGRLSAWIVHSSAPPISSVPCSAKISPSKNSSPAW